MREDPKAFQVYRHFKGDYYQIIEIANHSETGERLVIYRSLFGEKHVCARPLDMFLSEVDHDKYPDVKQKWRFALVTGQLKNPQENKEDSAEDDSPEEAGPEVGSAEDNSPEDNSPEDNNPEDNSADEVTEDVFLDKFLDAESYEEKLDIFTGMWKTLNEDNIDNVALVMDLELRGGTIEEKYKEILNCLKMKARYESTRLRQS